MGQGHNLHSFLCTWTLILGTFLVPVGAPAAGSLERSEVFALAEVERGQKGYGLSVFQGHTAARFEVEVVGVWEDVQPDTSYILARLSGQNLEETGVIAGMSGSPVYIEDRLVGAVAFAWPFANDAIAGITPIESMRRMAEIEVPTARGVSPTVDLSAIVGGELPASALTEALEQLRPATVGASSAALEWSASGFGTKTMGLLETAVGNVATAGRAYGFSGDLEPGSAVAAVLIDGDFRLASTGTVTDRFADTVLAFGHPFLGLGKLRIPMAAAEVITVVSSLANSFKLANLGEIVGALDFDHAVGVRGKIGLESPMIPMRVRLQGDGAATLDLRLANLEPVTPALVAIATLGALDSATAAVGSRGLDMIADIDLGTAGRLQIDQSFEGATAGFDAALYLFAITGYLLQNELAEVTIESIDLDVERYLEPRTLRLVGAHAARSVVRPGETVTLNLDLVEYRGGSIRKSVPLAMPTNLPAGRYSLLVGDGASVDAARLAIERVEPVTFSQALEFLDSLSSRRELVVIGVFGEPGLSVAGEVMPRLPGSLRSLWGAAPSGSATALRMAIAQQDRLRLAVPAEGLLRVDLQVERRKPLSPSPPPSVEPAGEAPGGPGGAGQGEGEAGAEG